MHDVVTVTRAAHVAPAGFASAEYSWFPGYAWTILMCSRYHKIPASTQVIIRNRRRKGGLFQQ
ncbi:putative cereblon [Operophtera brumata]|uniref:Putative cereblon n=1 Tax=Operophtera brumata TaxID=104452 RepID=A0A0L7KUM2_OPEBR|nr:putative cereblon [Operophtera brumata]